MVRRRPTQEQEPEESVTVYRHVVRERATAVWPPEVARDFDAHVQSQLQLGLYAARIEGNDLDRLTRRRRRLHAYRPSFRPSTAPKDKKVWRVAKRDIAFLRPDLQHDNLIRIEGTLNDRDPAQLDIRISHHGDAVQILSHLFRRIILPTRRPTVSVTALERLEVYATLTHRAVKKVHAGLRTAPWVRDLPALHWKPDAIGQLILFEVQVPAEWSPTGEQGTLRAYRHYQPDEARAAERGGVGPFKLELILPTKKLSCATMVDPVRTVEGAGARWLRKLLRSVRVRRTARKPDKWRGRHVPKQAAGGTLNVRQRHILARLAGGGELAPKELRADDGRSQSAFSNALRALEQRGLVERHKAGRGSTVKITAFGLASWRDQQRRNLTT